MAYFLNVGDLSSGTCSINDYVIDWHIDSVGGDVGFVTANAGNPESGVDAYHPIVDEVLPAATYYPVIRYVYIGADKFTAVYEEGAYYSPDLATCLSPITIDPIDCSASNFTPTEQLPYDFRVLRDVGEGSKDRTFNFEIGATTNYFAWAINTDNISDQIKIYYCTLLDPDGTLIDNLVTGTDATTNYNPVSYPVNPIIIDNSVPSQVIKYVSDLTGFSYITGDFIKVEVLGNYYNPSLDGTKWTIYMRCLESLDSLPDMVPTFTKIASTTIDHPFCEYSLYYEVDEPMSTYSEFPSNDLFKYFTYSYTPPTFSSIPNNYRISINWSETAPNQGSFATTCQGLNGSVNVSKIGTVVTWTFTNTLDYDKFVNDYNIVTALSGYIAGISADPTTDVGYYGIFVVRIYKNLGGCDTSVPFDQVVISIHSDWTFDPIDKEVISVDLVAIPDLLIPYGDCNTWNETATGNSNEVASFISTSDFSYDAEVRTTTYIGGSMPIPNSPSSSITQLSYVQFYNIMLNGIYSPTNPLGWVSISNFWRAYSQYDRFTFSDTSSDAARINSWCLERSRFFTTLDEADYTTYDVIDCAPSTTTTTTTTL